MNARIQRTGRWIGTACLVMGSLAGMGASRPEPARHAVPYNVLFLAIDDLRPELSVYGGFAETPNLDALARRGRLYSRHYVQVPTCGASRVSVLCGLVPTEATHLANGAASTLRRAEGPHVRTLPESFRMAGYRTVALGKISHAPGGRLATGEPEIPRAWDDLPTHPGIWKDNAALLHAYAHGKPRIPGKSPIMQFEDVPDTGYPDGILAEQAVAQLRQLAGGEQPFFLAVGFYKPHLPFCAPRKYRDRVDDASIPDAPVPGRPEGVRWNQPGEVTGNYAHPFWDDKTWDKDERRQMRAAYAACCSYVDAQVGKVLDALAKSGAADRTVIVVWGDHGWHLGDVGRMGKHALFEEALRSALIVSVPGMREPGSVSERLVASIDLMPTLGRICGVTMPEGLPTVGFADDLVVGADGEIRDGVLSWWGKGVSLRTDTHRLIRYPEGPELYELGAGHVTHGNVASEQPERVAQFTAQANRLLAREEHASRVLRAGTEKTGK